jgi:hypothetical protein
MTVPVLILAPIGGCAVTGILIALAEVSGAIRIRGIPPTVIRRSTQPAKFRNWITILWLAFGTCAALSAIAYLGYNSN